MIATDMATLDALFQTAIAGISPRMTRSQDHGWTPYKKTRKGAHFTRAFRLDWTPREYVEDGIFTPAAVESEAVVSVVTDYRDAEEHVQFLVEDDKHQLRDTLNGLMGADNGMLWAEALPTEIEQDDEQGSVIVVHPFTIRYLRARA